MAMKQQKLRMLNLANLKVTEWDFNLQKWVPLKKASLGKLQKESAEATKEFNDKVWKTVK
jgi:hypothetical protein